MSILHLARPELQHFKAYSSARNEASSVKVMLNANESPWPGNRQLPCNRYPEPQPPALKDRLASIYGVSRDKLLLVRGSDEAIDLLLRGFCRPGNDRIIISPPTFGMYAVSARIQGAKVVPVPLLPSTFALDTTAIEEAIDDTIKLIFVCSPNNPTGSLVPLDVIEHLAEACRGKALVIVDEAYIEFATSHSATTLLDTYPNLGVLRTLSKAWGMAGARVGALLAHPDMIGLLSAIMSPYPLSTPSINAAMDAIHPAHTRHMRQHVVTLRNERERLQQALIQLPGVRHVLPSHANFLCVRFDHAQATYDALMDKGIAVRNVTTYPGLADALRISIGTPDENTALLTALKTLGSQT